MSLPNKTYEAIVVGGGLAGSSAAFHLARAGQSTLLLEEKSGPHHKVCGEFLSSESLPYLAEMGIDLNHLGASRLTHATLYSPHQRITLKLPQMAYGLSRYQLDEVLLQRAVKQGAEVKRGHRVIHIEKSGEFFCVRTPEENFESRVLFLATGKHEITAFHRREGRSKNLLGLKMHYQLNQSSQDLLKNQVELYFFKDGYVGLSLVENNIANLCLLIDSARCQANGGFEPTLDSVMAQNPIFAQRMQDAIPLFEKPVAIAHVPYGHLNAAPQQKNLYLLGDQFGVMPSFSGTGMTLALMSARAAVENFVNPSKENNYKNKMLSIVKPAMRLAYPIHWLCQSPKIADGLFMVLNRFPKLVQKICWETRIRT